MIENDQQLQQSLEQMERMYRAVASLRARHSTNPQQFQLLAEGPADELRRLQAEIDSYLGLTALTSP